MPGMRFPRSGAWSFHELDRNQHHVQYARGAPVAAFGSPFATLPEALLAVVDAGMNVPGRVPRARFSGLRGGTRCSAS